MGNIEAGNQGVNPEQESMARSINGVVEEIRVTKEGLLEVILRGVEKPFTLALGGNEERLNGEIGGKD